MSVALFHLLCLLVIIWYTISDFMKTTVNDLEIGNPGVYYLGNIYTTKEQTLRISVFSFICIHVVDLVAIQPGLV
jgi:hypothetical protein